MKTVDTLLKHQQNKSRTKTFVSVLKIFLVPKNSYFKLFLSFKECTLFLRDLLKIIFEGLRILNLLGWSETSTYVGIFVRVKINHILTFNLTFNIYQVINPYIYCLLIILQRRYISFTACLLTVRFLHIIS